MQNAELWLICFANLQWLEISHGEIVLNSSLFTFNFSLHKCNAFVH